uniref:Uncharacterized protein n=1 Tax=Siphoviridae sp. ctqPo10 TaxID=2827948 RepID=A0A8S5SV03_9CAUD|nr:MAG TPA: hypothetical protein [Siphoviridae sp. ctqPo10]DAS43391.1 MAG TPA: hypothetical protein [Caudoviricetes sp.]
MKVFIMFTCHLILLLSLNLIILYTICVLL